jgi:cell wall-associated NlpC family hydrolase
MRLARPSAGRSVECAELGLRHSRCAADIRLVTHAPVTHAPLTRARTCSRSRTRTRTSCIALLAAIAVLPAGSAIAAAHATVSAASWDSAAQHQVVAAGLMAESGGSFDGAGRLTSAQANAAMVALAARLQHATSEQGAQGQPAPSEPGASAEAETEAEGEAEGEEAPIPGTPNPTAAASAAGASVAPVAHTAQNPVTVATFDRMLVEELGLADVAGHVQATAAAAGLRPPAYFGSEVAARLLELRYEHPVGSQRFDLFPEQPITRAEAAWSLAQVIGSSAGSISGAREALSAFELPQMTAAQRQALQIAVSRIGYPYVWGGTTDNTADGLEHGGFDCSGFAWRVYKVSGLPWGRKILGRTAAEQAGEIPKSQRLRTSQLEPGDLLFFGSAHFDSRATASDIIHEGIYLGDNWVIHSSGQGVYVLPLSGSWLGSSFAWGRRVID